MAEWRTEWTGSYPNFCSGEWHLYKDDEEVENIFGSHPAGTLGTYSEWFFDDGYLETWRDYRDGMGEKVWVRQNKDWLKKIADEEDFPKIYKAFQENDWRYSCCGGCI